MKDLNLTLELTNMQRASLIEEVKEYKSIEDLILLYEAVNVYRKGSFMNALANKKMEFLKSLK